MNLILRFWRIIIQALFRRHIGVFEDSIVYFRVLPHDLDFNLHMTNSRYLSVMDLARVDRLVRTGLGKLVFQEKWGTVLGASYIRFRKSLNLFQKYAIRTQVIGVDEKWFYIQHLFEVKGQIVAMGFVKALFLKKGKSIPTKNVIMALGDKDDFKAPPKPPLYIKEWIEMEENFKKALAIKDPKDGR
jgi:acyl-CoA thioesterase FadM